MTEQTITSPDLSRSAQRLLIDTANKLSLRGLDLTQTVDATTMKVILGVTAHRIHGVSELTATHREAARIARRWETIADGRSLQERRRPTHANADNTCRALSRLSPLYKATSDAFQLVEAAKQAATEDLEAALNALGDLTGLTNGQAIERMYAAAGIARYWA